MPAKLYLFESKKKVKFLVHLELGLPYHNSESGKQTNKYNPLESFGSHTCTPF
jgi:hypothetical protein